MQNKFEIFKNRIFQGTENKLINKEKTFDDFKATSLAVQKEMKKLSGFQIENIEQIS